MTDNYTHSSISSQDPVFELRLRPESFLEFVGHDNIRKRLQILIDAATKRKEALGHILLSGPPGLGKTTLAHILANSMGSNIFTTSGPVLEKAADLAGILTNLKEKDVLFIDEIHRLPKAIEEYLYSAMEDFTLDLIIDAGPAARSIQVKLNPFTLIGATTRQGLISAPMRSRFLFNTRLDYYENESLEKIIQRSSKLMKIPIDIEGAKIIAHRSRGTPRIANNLLRWVRDCAQTKNMPTITASLASKALDMLSIDHLGLDEIDKKILSTIIDHFDGGPVGIQTLGVALSEEPLTLAEVHEPYLIMKGFIKRTLRGREVTKLAYKHLGRKIPEKFHGGIK